MAGDHHQLTTPFAVGQGVLSRKGNNLHISTSALSRQMPWGLGRPSSKSQSDYCTVFSADIPKDL